MEDTATPSYPETAAGALNKARPQSPLDQSLGLLDDTSAKLHAQLRQLCDRLTPVMLLRWSDGAPTTTKDGSIGGEEEKKKLQSDTTRKISMTIHKTRQSSELVDFISKNLEV